MKKAPNIWTLKGLMESAGSNSVKLPNGWVPARPQGLRSFKHRVLAAWEVFVGRADAVIWPGGQ